MTEAQSLASSSPAHQATLDSLRGSTHPACLLCGPGNALGVRLRFRVRDDGSVLAFFPCREFLQSYPDTLHGGVISALLDAAMTNALFSIGIAGLTAELTVRFVSPVSLNQGAIVTAAVERNLHPLYLVRARLEQDGVLRARASAKFLARGSV